LAQLVEQRFTRYGDAASLLVVHRQNGQAAQARLESAQSC
jgi:hypothetical protein